MVPDQPGDDPSAAHDRPDDLRRQGLSRGILSYNNPRNGYRVIKLHYTADPDRDEAWVARTRKLYSPAAWDQEFELKRTATTLLVWPGFSEADHVVAACPLQGQLALTVGLDPGWDHPFAAVFVATDEDGRACVVDEHVQRATLISEHADVLLAKARAVLKLDAGVPDRDVAKRVRWVIDPSQAQIIHELSTHGILPFRKPAGSNVKINDVGAGINRVGEWLADVDPWGPRLTFVRSRTTHLRYEMAMYQWERSASGQPVRDKVRKLNDDACDALRYAMMARPRRARAEQERDPCQSEHYDQTFHSWHQMNRSRLRKQQRSLARQRRRFG